MTMYIYAKDIIFTVDCLIPLSLWGSNLLQIILVAFKLTTPPYAVRSSESARGLFIIFIYLLFSFVSNETTAWPSCGWDFE